MATLAENVSAVNDCLTAINAAITTKGGTLQGGQKLRNAAAGIATIPTGGTVPHWWDDLDATIFEFAIVEDGQTVTDFGKFPAGTTVWWDANAAGSSASAGYVTKASAAAISHTYATAGTYVVIVKDAGTSWQSRFNNTDFVSYLRSLVRLQSNVANIYSWMGSYGCQGMEVKARDFSNVTSWTEASLSGAIFTGDSVTIAANASERANFRMSYFAANTVTITGVGGMAKYGMKKINLPAATVCGDFQGSNSLREIYAPNATTLYGYTFYGCVMLSKVTLGTLTALPNTAMFQANPGSLATADSEGYKLKITVGNTCASFMALTNYAGAIAYAPHTMKVICSDGYIAYDESSSAWVAHTT